MVKQKPSLDAVVKIADYFDVSIDYLMGREIKQSNLSQNQKQLLTCYDTCDEIDKVRILTYAEAVAENKHKI